MPADERRPSPFERGSDGGWWFARWASRRVMAGVSGRHVDLQRWFRRLPAPRATVEAEQVHGASVAIIEGTARTLPPIAGCDALLTAIPGVSLMIRSADCLPVFFADPLRGVVGIAHAGWRGLAGLVLARVVAAFRHSIHTRAEELYVAIGPSIRACCYEVGPEFAARFGPFVHEQAGRRMCDLPGVAKDQLRRCGVPPARVLDSRRCTGCEPQEWFSLRREGAATGRLISLIMLRP